MCRVQVRNGSEESGLGALRGQIMDFAGTERRFGAGRAGSCLPGDMVFQAVGKNVPPLHSRPAEKHAAADSAGSGTRRRSSHNSRVSDRSPRKAMGSEPGSPPNTPDAGTLRKSNVQESTPLAIAAPQIARSRREEAICVR